MPELKDLYQVQEINMEVLLSHTHSIVCALAYFDPFFFLYIRDISADDTICKKKNPMKS